MPLLHLSYDYIIVGGGLSGALLAHRWATLSKGFSVLLIEKEARLGGKHTWSFHETDVPPSAKEWFLPLASKTWGSHTVQFPRYSRQLLGSYASIRSLDLNAKIQENKGIHFLFNQEVKTIEAERVLLPDGTWLSAKAVFDARGFADLEPQANAYQKFVGLTVRLKGPHGLKDPILMDATVEQLDGYRFMYVLPWNETEALLEDTYYSEFPTLDRENIKQRIHAYIAAKGWELIEVLDEEEGILPIPLYEGFLRSSKKPLEILESVPVPLIGVRAGMFNRTTGFSLPVLLEWIERVIQLEVRNSREIHDALCAFVREKESQHRWFCFLNRVLFWGIESHLRFKVLQEFYTLPEKVIARFYATQMRALDWLRFFSRKPPVPMGKALQSGFKKRVLTHA